MGIHNSKHFFNIFSLIFKILLKLKNTYIIHYFLIYLKIEKQRLLNPIIEFLYGKAW